MRRFKFFRLLLVVILSLTALNLSPLVVNADITETTIQVACTPASTGAMGWYTSAGAWSTIIHSDVGLTATQNAGIGWKTEAGNTWRVYQTSYAFDVDELPEGTNILSAKMRFYVDQEFNTGTWLTQEYAIYKSSKDSPTCVGGWSTTDFDSPLEDFGDSAVQISDIKDQDDITIGAWVEFNINASYLDWIIDGKDSEGQCVIAILTTNHGSESAPVWETAGHIMGWISEYGDDANPPELVVDYVIGYDSEPDVITGAGNNLPDGIQLNGYATDVEPTSLDTVQFGLGTESGNYTSNITATTISNNLNGSWRAFSAEIPTADLTLYEHYYFRAEAENAIGWGYGDEQEFTFYPSGIDVTTDQVSYFQGVSGNSTASFGVRVNPPYASDNISARLSSDYDFGDLITLYNYPGDYGSMLFSTSSWNGTGYSGVLLPDTTYYYQGYATTPLGTTYYSQIKSFTTENYTLPSIPTVSIINVKDVSNQYNDNYVFEMTAKITSDNTTEIIYNKGFQFSLYSANNELLPTIYSYNSPSLNLDNTFNMVITLGSADWYNGEKIYIRAFIDTENYGRINSKIVPFQPLTNDDGISGVAGGSIEDVISGVRNSLGLTGTFGIWAFLFIILLCLALVFGVAYFNADSDKGKRALAIIWALLSITAVGAFMFTGQLGIWPILILAGGVVAWLMIFFGSRLSGGTE